MADFIRRRGRIAISELAAKSNQFIDLEEKASEQLDFDGLDLDIAEQEGQLAAPVSA